MAPHKRRAIGRLKGPQAATPQTSLSTQAVNTCGFPALPDEIYLEIMSHIPSIPIPTPINYVSQSYPEIRRLRHETLLSLSQTSRSLRRFFWRYLWQRIEVHEGMRIREQDDTLEGTPYLTNRDTWHKEGLKKYTTELVRQLEIVTVRNPQLAQYVKSVPSELFVLQFVHLCDSYVDIFIGDYSFDRVLAELARCLSLFSNLHTVQIDVATLDSRKTLAKIFKRTFKAYSFPQIRNVFVISLSQSLIASCPEARRVGFAPRSMAPKSYMRTIIDNCPRLEVLEDFNEFLWEANICKRTILYLFLSQHCKILTVFTSPRHRR